MEKETKNKLIALSVLVSVVIITITIIQLVGFGIDLLRKKFNLNNNITPLNTELTQQNIKTLVEQNQASEYPDFDFYSTLNKINLTSSTESWVSQSGFIEGRTYKKFIKVQGEIANAYLFVNVSVDNGKPLTVWDSIYVSLRKESNGYLYQPIEGHLLRSKSLNMPASDTAKLLYDMKQIPFTTIPYSDDNKFINKNWLALIQGAKKFQFETFLSTSRKGGKINDISIGYQCSMETPDCKLEIIQ